MRIVAAKPCPSGESRTSLTGMAAPHPTPTERESVMHKKENPPGAATPGEISIIPIEDYGRGSYTQRELVEQLLEIDPQLHSVNLILK